MVKQIQYLTFGRFGYQFFPDIAFCDGEFSGLSVFYKKSFTFRFLCDTFQ